MEKIYVAGKVTGMEAAAKLLFAEAVKNLRQAGKEPVNPLELRHVHDGSWESFMKVCIPALCSCDAVYMLPNWRESKGANVEHSLAEKLGMTIYYEL